MKIFHYKVSGKENQISAGELEANDLNQAAAILISQKFTILSLSEAAPDIVSELSARFSKPKLEDVSNFTRQLSTMVVSGLSIVEALKILSDQAKPAMAKVIRQVGDEVSGGRSLAESMEKFPAVFSRVYVALVRAGESAGVLDKVLLKLADTLEKQREFRGKTKGAMIYPIIVVLGMVGVGFVMMIFVVPKMTAMYQDFGADLPVPTKILIGVSNFFVGYWPVALALMVGVVWGLRKWAKTDVGGLIIEKAMFKMPIIGPLQFTIILTDFARTMGLLLTAGISVLEGLRIVADTMSSRVFRDGVYEAAEHVEKGLSMSESLSRSTKFPRILGQMVAVGEQTGKVDETLSKLATFYEQETEIKVKALTTAVEPLIMLVLGIGVAFMVFAVVMPIYNLTSKF